MAPSEEAGSFAAELGVWQGAKATLRAASGRFRSPHLNSVCLFRNRRYIRISRNVDGVMTEFARIAKTNVYPKAEFTASDLKRGGAVLEAASDGKVVRIKRRDTRFLLIREDHLMALVAELTDTTPKSLEQMLEGFTAEDATSLRERMTAWRADEPVGKELI
jgi:hypothetical protein